MECGSSVWSVNIDLPPNPQQIWVEAIVRPGKQRLNNLSLQDSVTNAVSADREHEQIATRSFITPRLEHLAGADESGCEGTAMPLAFRAYKCLAWNRSSAYFKFAGSCGADSSRCCSSFAKNFVLALISVLAA